MKKTPLLHLLMSLFVMATLLTGIGQAALKAVGPVDPVTTIPSWYQDTNNLALVPCLDQNGFCVLPPPFDPAIPPTSPITTVGPINDTNLPAESFYYSADALLLIEGGELAKLSYVLEYAFLSGVIPNTGIAFLRTDLQKMRHLTPNSTYRVTHPYGQFEFTTDAIGDTAAGGGVAIRQEDPAGVPADWFPPLMKSAANTNIGPFLTPAPTVPPTPLPTDLVNGELHTYLSNPAVAIAVTGSPTGNNFFRVERLNALGVPVPGAIWETNLWFLAGRVFTGQIPSPMNIDRVTYARDATSTQIDVFASAFPTALLSIAGTAGLPSTALTQDVPNSGKFFAHIPLAALPTGVAMTNSLDVPPILYPITLVDEVVVSLATYNPVNRSLTIKAASRDKLSPPTLSVPAFAAPNTLNASGTVVLPLPNAGTIPPMTVQVVSSNGGSATALVSVATPPAAPLAVDDSAATTVGTAVSINVLANDSSAGTIDPASVAIVTPPASGATAVPAANGTVLYTPTGVFSGTETFSYTVRDSFTQVSNTATVTVTVHSAPVALPDSATAAVTRTININLIANDVATASSINSATVNIVSPVSCGIATILTNGTVDFTAPATVPAAPGTCSFSYVVSDSFVPSATSNVATVTVTIALPPTITINTPANGATIDLGTATTITATPAAVSGATVFGVEFHENGVLIGQAFAAPFSTTWTPATAGARTLTATAFYSNFATATSTPATAVTINGTVITPASITVPTTSTTGNYTVSWTAAVPATVGATYTLEESTTPGFTAGTTRIVTSGLSALSANITGITTRATYYYRVKAVKAPMLDSLPVIGQCVVTVPAAMTTPTVPFTFTGTTQAFNWNNAGGDAYVLNVGTTLGANNIAVKSTGTAQSTTVTNLPINGSTVYVRLWTLFGATWYSNDYIYTAANLAPAAITNPTVPFTFTGTTQTFNWNNAGGDAYVLNVGTTLGANNIAVKSTGSALTTTVTNLPINGSTVYVRLLTLFGATWYSNDYIYTAANLVPAAITNPTVPFTFTGTSQTFNWNNVGAAAYVLNVGTTSGAKDIAVMSTGTALTTTVTNLPVNGSTIYVRLWSLLGTTWYSNDYIYTAANIVAPVMTNPTVPFTFTGTSQTFNWTNVGASMYILDVGTTSGARDIARMAPGTALTTTVTNLPVGGGAVYVRLYALFGSTWVFNDYIYTAF